MESCVAKLELIGQNEGEEPFQIVAEIGTPYQKNTDPEEWWCPVSVVPLFNNLHDAVGGGSFQSLCLGVALVLNLLQGFKEKGGTLHFKDGGGEVPLEAYAFGISVKKP